MTACKLQYAVFYAETLFLALEKSIQNRRKNGEIQQKIERKTRAEDEKREEKMEGGGAGTGRGKSEIMSWKS